VDNRTEQLADGVWRVEVAYATNAFVLADDGIGDAEGLTVVDTGWRSGGPRLVRSIRMLGLDPRAVGRVLLTHWHVDHAGSAAAFARSSAGPTGHGASVHAGVEDLDVVAGRQPRPYDAVPDGWTSVAGRLAARLGLMRPADAVPDAKPLHDGATLEVAGGLEVVHAPGHTPGHTAFWLPSRGVLLAGDAVWNTWVTWRGPSMSCSALPAIPATLRRLAGCGAATLAVAHGPPLRRAVRDRLEGLAEREERRRG
jgi:glyoxylase-like metal-dependent hydrolase (beta-lactamase superfamily II)